MAVVPCEVKLKPEKWVKVGTIKRLILYPIKSCAGTFVDKGVITTLGLKDQHANIRDRDFMVVDESGKQVTMTKHPQMALINVKINGDNTLTVTAPDVLPYTFTYPQPDGTNERIINPLFRNR